MARRVLSIAYNLQAWLATRQPGIITAVGTDEDTPEDIVILIDNGGDKAPWYERQDINFQILGRNKSRVKAGEQCAIIAGELTYGYGLVLPEVTIDGTVYPEVTVWEFKTPGRTGYTGADVNRLHVWSANHIITIGG